MISLAIHFPSNLSHSVTRRLRRSDLGGFRRVFCQQSHTPTIIIIRKSFISPITTDIIIFIFLPHLVLRSGGDNTGSLTFSTQHILSIRSGRRANPWSIQSPTTSRDGQKSTLDPAALSTNYCHFLSLFKTRELHTQSD